MDEGYFCVDRSIWTNGQFASDEPFSERLAFIWMISEAAWKPRKIKIGDQRVELQRGQFSCSVRYMAEAWGWSKSRVDRFLKRLQKWDTIGTDSGTGQIVVTLCKYDEYQRPWDSSGTAPGQERDKTNTVINKNSISPDQAPGAREPELPLVAEGEPAKPTLPPAEPLPAAKARKPTTGSALLAAKGAAEAFEGFWAAYPRKDDKEAARRAFAKALEVPDTTAEQLVACARAFAITCRKEGREAKFIKHAATWLNGLGWQDVLAQASQRLSPVPAPAGAPGERPYDREMRRRLTQFKIDGSWARGLFGDPPGSPTCTVDKRLLREFGFAA
jgi:hypothetical protein